VTSGVHPEERSIKVKSIRLSGVARQLGVVQEDTRNHFTLRVAPWLAGFTLPPIVQLALSPRPWQPWHEASLAFFIAATGLLLAGYQLSIGSLYRDECPWNEIRASLTFGGLVSLMVAVSILIWSTAGVGPVLALVVLVLGIAVPILLRVGLSVRSGWSIWKRIGLEPTKSNGPNGIDEIAVEVAEQEE